MYALHTYLVCACFTYILPWDWVIRSQNEVEIVYCQNILLILLSVSQESKTHTAPGFPMSGPITPVLIHFILLLLPLRSL